MNARVVLGALLVTGGLLASGCSLLDVDETSGQEAVSFRTYGRRAVGGQRSVWKAGVALPAGAASQGAATRAGDSYIAPGGNFATGDTIVVFGFYHPGDGVTDGSWAAENAAGTNIPDFMYDQAVIKQANGSWDYSPKKYWPNEYGTGATSAHKDKLSFWGYYPKSAAGLTLYAAGTTNAYTNATSGLPKIHFCQSTDPDEQVDLMLSTLLSDLYKTQAHEVDEETWHYGALTNGQVGLTFCHALALVEIEIAEGTGADVTYFGLTNIYRSGTLENPATLTWTGQGDSHDFEEENMEVTGTNIATLLMMPQTLSADATLTIDYDIEFDSFDPSHPDPIVYSGETITAKLFKNTGDPAVDYGVTAWLPGHHYVYRVSRGLDRIEFEEIVEAGADWDLYTPEIDVTD